MEKIKESEEEYRGGDWGVKYLFRGPKIDWGVILLKPGQRLGGHYHHEVEETFYFLSGTPKFVIDGIEHRVQPGEAYRVEAHESHDLINDTTEDLIAIFIKYPYNPEDRHAD